SLYARAPLDLGLAARLLRQPSARGAALGYLSGFTKINDSDRFEPDLFEAEGARFDRAYRPIAQIDRQRIEYLYAGDVGPDSPIMAGYLAEFEELIEYVQSRGIRFVVVRPPIPERVYAMLPDEEEFELALRSVLDAHAVDLLDYTTVNNDP